MMPGNVIGKMQALKNFRSYFFRGMAALLPTILTIWIFVQCYIFIQGKVSIHINRGLVRLILLMTGNWEEEFLVSFWVDGPGRITGFFVAIIGVCSDAGSAGTQGLSVHKTSDGFLSGQEKFRIQQGGCF
ncbi:MAG: hypothetical protein ACYSOT_04130 [Planctomycetota bacterium]|jgi:hypothetical protein